MDSTFLFWYSVARSVGLAPRRRVTRVRRAAARFSASRVASPENRVPRQCLPYLTDRTRSLHSRLTTMAGHRTLLACPPFPATSLQCHHAWRSYRLWPGSVPDRSPIGCQLETVTDVNPAHPCQRPGTLQRLKCPHRNKWDKGKRISIAPDQGGALYSLLTSSRRPSYVTGTVAFDGKKSTLVLSL